MDDAEAALVVLAGGAATRCPGKLERPIGDLPMLVHTYRNLCGFVRTYVSLSHDISAAIKEQLDAELIFDREPLQGPLSALVGAFNSTPAARVFVVAGDMPFAQRSTLREIASAWRAGDEAVVALDEAGKPQPLLALYDRRAFLRVAACVHDQRSGVKDVLRALRWRGIALRDFSAMFNVNNEAQYSEAKMLASAGA